jgi:hypothetical protein
LHRLQLKHLTAALLKPLAAAVLLEPALHLVPDLVQQLLLPAEAPCCAMGSFAMLSVP